MALPRYDDSTALIVVDMQNDFADPAGSLYVDGGETLVEPVNDAIRQAQHSGALVVYTQDWHPPSTPHFEKDGGIWPVHCLADSWGASFHESLQVADGAPVVRKGTDGGDGYSGFSVRDPKSGEEQATELAGILRDRDITRVVVVGLAQDFCVRETALDAVRHGLDTRVQTGLTRPVELEPGDGRQALDEMRLAGVSLD